MTEEPQPVWQVPDPISIHDVTVDGKTVIRLRRHGNPQGPRLIMSHGNGLAIDLYYPFWSNLLDDFDIIIYDLRNHGWNSVGDISSHNLPTFIRDYDRVLETIREEYGDKPTFGVYHSISALVALLSSQRGDGLTGLYLFDPPVCRPGGSYEEFEVAATRAANLTRTRTERYPTRAEFAGVLPFMPTFRNVVPGIPDLVAETTLRRSDDSEAFVLRCPREFEAQVVEYAGVFAVSVDFDRIVCPVRVVGADPTLPYSYLPTMDLSDILSIDYDFMPEASHFMIFERPDECAASVREYVQSLSP